MAAAPMILPVRHHSPACARLVRDTIRDLKPQVVLIEGPSDASSLIPALLDPDTHPPVALMAYFQPGARNPASESTPASLFYPFCDYSPEWVAMREGSAAGAEVRFCDLPAGPMLIHEDEEGPARPDFGQAIADSYGFQTHEEWWEALFEGQRHTADTLIGLLRAYGEEVAGEGDPFTRLREEWMWHTVEEAIGAGAAPERVILVCGAAHAVRLPPTGAGKPKVPKTPPVEFALTPYTYAHLSRRSGYGAGNRSPLLFQRAWELGDLSQAAAAGLVETAAALRSRGWTASTADSIAACATAEQLAGLRNKAAPGADEIRLAARASWSQSQGEMVEGALSESLDEALIGASTGSVAESAGATPLSADFYRRARRFWRNIDAVEREMLLKLTDPNDRERSCFLHQLRVSGIDFAWLRDRPAQADPGIALRTRYEAWVRRWAPQTAMTLAERSPLGASVSEVARQLLREALRDRPPLSQAAAALQDAALCGLEELLNPALEAVDAASVMDSAWEDLSRSIARLNRLNADTGLPEAIRNAASGLVTRLFARACLHLLEAARCPPERAPVLGAAIAELHEIAISAAGLDTVLWWRALDGVLQSSAAQPYLAGLAAALLRSQNRVAPAEFVRILQLRLSPVLAPEEGASFVEGLLSLNRGVLLRSAELARALNRFVEGLRADQFLVALPLLRRAFQGLSRAETQRFVETLGPALFEPEAEEIETGASKDVLAEARRLIEEILEQGTARLDDYRDRLRPVVMTLLDAPEGSSERRAGEWMRDLAELSSGTPAAPPLLQAWQLLRLLRLTPAAETVLPEAPVPGLSLLPPESPVNFGRSVGQDTEREAMTDSRAETRPRRVALVAQALADPGDLTPLLPLLAHGDYTRLMIRQFSLRHDAITLARHSLEFRNPLVRRAGVEIAGRVLHHGDTESTEKRREKNEEKMRDGGREAGTGLEARGIGPEPGALRPGPRAPSPEPAVGAPSPEPAYMLLIAALVDPDLWPVAGRYLRARPDAAMEWARAEGADPAALKAGDPEEIRLARLAIILSSYPPAIPWLRSCQAAPDRLAVEAAISLTLLGAQSEEELQWVFEAREGAAAARAMLRYEIESGKRNLAAIQNMDAWPEAEPEVAAALDTARITAVAGLLAARPTGSAKMAPVVEVLGWSRSAAAVPALCPLLSSGHPLIAVTAAEALGKIGSESAVPSLLSRRAPAGSDADRAILHALGQIGDLRMLDAVRKRLRSHRPEEAQPAEMDALAAIGEPLTLALEDWLGDSSATVRAVAESLLDQIEPGRLIDTAEPEERVRRLCVRALLPGQAGAGLEAAMLAAAAEAGAAAVAPLTQALQSASGPAEASLARVLELLKSPAAILPLLRLPRTAAWKVSIPAAMGDSAVPALTLALGDSQAHVSRAAREALQAIGTPAALAALQGGGARKKKK